jgi:hypothetical protein
VKIKHFVRQSLFFLVLICSSIGWESKQVRAEILPEIDAQQITIIPTEISKSGRVYRFKTKSGDIPKTGSIILIQYQKKPIMAFRILNTNEENQEFIAKRVRRYDTEGTLKLNETYESAEKIANLVSPPTIETRFNPDAKPELDPIGGKNLNPVSTETERKLDPNAPPLMGDGGKASSSDVSSSGAAPRDLEHYDSDLDSGTSPRNLKRSKEDEESDENDDRSPSSKSDSDIEEFKTFNPFKHMIGVSLGNFRNLSNFSIPGTSHNGFYGDYSQVMQRGVYFRNRRLQDTFAFDLGFAYYSRTNFTGNNDSYELLPLKVEGLYSLYFSESFAFLGYFGLQYNIIFSTNNVKPASFPDEQTALNTLSGIQPNLGIGVLYNIGPQWYIRADIGIDRLALGLAVKW